MGTRRPKGRVDALVQALVGQDETASWAAFKSLQSLGRKALPAILDQLRTAPSEAARRALVTFMHLEGLSTSDLESALADSHFMVRKAGLSSLGMTRHQDAARACFPALMRAMLEDEDSENRKEAAESLRQVHSKIAVPGMIASLHSSSGRHRKSLEKMLEERRPQASTHVRGLIDKALNATVERSQGRQPLPATGLFGVLGARARGRWDHVRAFVELWFGKPFRGGDGFSKAEVEELVNAVKGPVPSAVREWYALGARRFDGPCDAYILTDADDVEDRDPDDRFLSIYEEPPGGVFLGVKLTKSADPPVTNEGVGKPVAPSFSTFILTLLMNDRIGLTAVDDNPSTSGKVRKALLHGTGLHTALERSYWPVPLPAWGAVPFRTGKQIRYFADGETLLRIDGDEWAFAAARTPAAWRRIEKLVASGASFGSFDAYLDS